MKKILHITMSNAYGGAETVIFSIIDNLNEHYDFSYLCPKGSIEEILKEKKVKYKTFNSMKDIFAIRKIIKEVKPDIVHTHDFTASVICALLIRGNSIISHLHTSHKWIKTFNLKSLVYYLAALKFNEIILVSNSMKEEMFFYKKLSNKVKVLINSVDTERVSGLANEVIEEEIYDLGFIGRLSEYKDPLKFITIVNEVKKANKNVKAIIIGDGELYNQCSERICELNLERSITMKGFMKNPFTTIENTKIIVLPSKVEALGLAAIEAMSLGKVIVASNLGGFKDFINTNNNGILCNDVEEFIFNVEKLLEDECFYKNLALNAMNTAKSMKTVEQYMVEICNIYDGEGGNVNDGRTTSISYNGNL